MHYGVLLGTYMPKYLRFAKGSAMSLRTTLKMDQNRLKSHQHNDAFKEIQGQNKLHFAAGDAVAHLKLKERSVSNF